MKIKILFSTIFLAIFGLLGGASIDEDGSLSGWVWIVLIGSVVAAIACVIQANAEEKNKREKAAAAREKRLALEAEQKARFEEWSSQYLAENGTPDKTIIVKPNDEMEIIHVHENKKQVYLKGRMYDFKDFINVKFTDSPTIIKGKTTATTKSNTGSTVGRAIVGDVIAGPAGAIIGGTTGKKTTEFKHENDRIIHDYTVVVNINSISTPIVRINTGTDGKTTNEIVGLINVIIARR